QPTHAYMQCEAARTFEGATNGRFLSNAGIQNDNATPPTPLTVRVPDIPFTQFDGTFTADTGLLGSMGLNAGSTFYASGTTLINRTTPGGDVRIAFAAGRMDGNVANGKVTYLTGHDY